MTLLDELDQAIYLCEENSRQGADSLKSLEAFYWQVHALAVKYGKEQPLDEATERRRDQISYPVIPDKC